MRFKCWRDIVGPAIETGEIDGIEVSTFIEQQREISAGCEHLGTLVPANQLDLFQIRPKWSQES